PHLGDASGHRRLADALLLEGADDLSELAELDPGHRIAVLLDGGVGLALVCDGDHPIARGAGAPGEEDGKDSVAGDQADGTIHRRVTPRWEPSTKRRRCSTLGSSGISARTRTIASRNPSFMRKRMR